MKPKKNDILLILGLLLAAGLMWFFLRPGEPGAVVIVSQENGEVSRYSLSEDQTIELTGSMQGYNILVIEDGKAFISDANCGDHTCIHTGKISHEGEQIICLPHKLVIEVSGGGSSGLDASTH